MQTYWDPVDALKSWNSHWALKKKSAHYISLHQPVYLSYLSDTHHSNIFSLGLQLSKPKGANYLRRLSLTTEVSEDRNWASELYWMPNECFRNVLIRQFTVKIQSSTAHLGKTRCQENKQSSISLTLSVTLDLEEFQQDLWVFLSILG